MTQEPEAKKEESKPPKSQAHAAAPETVLCKECRHPIPPDARICVTCHSYQNWRRYIPFSNTALALLAALVSVTAIAAPAIYRMVHAPRSQAKLDMPSIDGTTLRIVALNEGDAPASIVKAWVDSDYLAPATKVRLRDDSDAIILPGSKLLAFNVVPLLDEDDSYRSSVEMLSFITQNRAAPRTEIRFHIRQSDGRFEVHAIALDAGDLFGLLRANADRCSAISNPNFENGCIGRGTPPQERFPHKRERIDRRLVDELESRINRSREAADQANRRTQ